MKRVEWALGRLLLTVLAFGCGPVTPMVTPFDAGVEPPKHAGSEPMQRCASSDVAAEPVSSIADAIARVNGLPKPVDAPCFLASLPRPFSVTATSSFQSAQPAVGRDNPRIMVLLPGLVVTVATDGEGQNLLEFGQWISPKRTLKGELKLPVSVPLAETAAFTQVHFQPNISSCALCHRDEQPYGTAVDSFSSLAFRPSTRSLVRLETLSALHEACIPSEQPLARCQMLHALFDFGEVRQGAFGAEVETFAP